VAAGEDPSLGEYLRAGAYGRLFAENHLLPMAAALWSTDAERVEAMPLSFLVRFLDNHGMMRFRGRPEWRVVEGGSREYVRALIRPFADRIRLSTPVEAIRRGPDGPAVRARGGEWERFDRLVVATHGDQALRLLSDPSPAEREILVRARRGEWERFDRLVVATHGDQALRLLSDPSPAEREILGAVRYQRNEVDLHTDTRFLPRSRRAWSSWNYHVPREPRDVPTVTYRMNQLQGLEAREQYLVTLNRTAEIDPARILRSFVYHHPIFDRESVVAQQRMGEIDGERDTWFAGAWRGFGFHEDGARSGEDAALAIARGARSAA
jgi:predicted NAD/FAD-binding protein